MENMGYGFRSRRSITSKIIGTITAGAVGAFAIGASAQTAGTPPTILQADWQATVAQSPSLGHAAVSAYAYDLTTGQVLGSINPSQRQIPASVTKIFTSAAALSELGPHFTYETRVAVPTAVLSGQPGPVYLVGGGDPWLEANGSRGLEALAAAVAKRIPSATQVIGVGSLFSSPAAQPAWSGDELPSDYAAATSALVAERSEVEVVVAAAASAGARPSVRLSFNSGLTDSGYFQIRDEATTTRGGGSRITVSRLPGTNTIVVQGTIAQGSSSGEFISVHDPALFAASLFEIALAKSGVRVAGPAATGTLPQGAVTVAVHASLPLQQLLKIQNRFSINLMADNLYRMLGAVRSRVGSPATAQAAMSAFLQKAGFQTNGLQVDGAGLSPLNEQSAADVVGLLAYASTQPWFGAFKDSLMEVGNWNGNPSRCGIICGHLLGTAAVDKVWLKTGNLENQWNYAGYATAANGDTIAFAILTDGPPTKLNDGFGGHLSPIDQMTLDLATWPREPAAPQAPAAGTKETPPSGLAALVRQFSAAPGAVAGGTVVDLRTGRTVWQQDAATLVRTNVVPRLGLLYAALAHGPKGFSKVTVHASGAVQSGTLHGSLILDGNGDPAISEANLQALATEVRAAGITQMTGALEYVQGPVAQSGWQHWPSGTVQEAVGQWWVPPISRLSVGGDWIAISVRATAQGAPAQVTLNPSDAAIGVENEVVGGSQGSKAQVSETWLRGTDTYVVSGTVPAGHSVIVTVAPPDAGQIAARVFLDALSAVGVQVQGYAIKEVPGAGRTRVIASMPGSTIASLAGTLLSGASTGTAAQIAQLMGPHAAKEITAAIGTTDFVQDPTGTSMADYMTPASVATILMRAWRQPAERPLVSALGTSGLLEVHGPESAAIVGYFVASDGTPYAVALLQSGLPFSGSFVPEISRVRPAP